MRRQKAAHPGRAILVACTTDSDNPDHQHAAIPQAFKRGGQYAALRAAIVDLRNLVNFNGYRASNVIIITPNGKFREDAPAK